MSTARIQAHGGSPAVGEPVGGDAGRAASEVRRRLEENVGDTVGGGKREAAVSAARQERSDGSEHTPFVDFHLDSPHL